MLTPRLAREALRPRRRIVKVDGTKEGEGPRALRTLPKGVYHDDDAKTRHYLRKKTFCQVRTSGYFITCLCVRKIQLLYIDGRVELWLECQLKRQL